VSVAHDRAIEPAATPVPIPRHEVGTLGTTQESSPIESGLQVPVHEAAVAEDGAIASVNSVPVSARGQAEAPSSASAPTVQPLVAQRTPLRTVVTTPRQPATPDSSPTLASLSGQKNVPEPSVQPPLGIGLLGERPVQRIARLSTPARPAPEGTVLIAPAGTPAPDAAVQRTVADARPPVSRTLPATSTSPGAATTFRTTEAGGMQTITFGAPSFESEPGQDPVAVQRAPNDDPTSKMTPNEPLPDVPTETTTRAESASIGPAAPVPEGPRQPTDAEVQDMLQALYPSLRRRLSRDLLLDRERLGYRTDIRF
jgi:hypothetical protein